ELDLLTEVAKDAVDPDAYEAAAAQLVELLSVLALPVAHHRSIEEEARVGRQRHQPVDDLLHGLGRDLAPARPARRPPDPRPEEPQMVSDLRDRADRRARVPADALLLDGDRRRQPLDAVAVGLRHLLEELAGVGRERFDVPSLALGVERVEGER